MTLKAVILDTDTFGQGISWQPLLDLPCDWSSYPLTTPAQLAQRIAGAQIVLTNKVVLDAQTLTANPALKYIGVLATGTNNIALEVAAELGMKVQNVEAYGTPSVVQHTLMLMLNLATSFPAYHQQVQRGAWQQSPHFCLLNAPITELAGKTLVIVGYGELGQGLASVAEALGMKVIVAATPGSKTKAVRPSLESVLPEADVLSLHCLLSDSTHHLIDAARLALMKPRAFVINTARGPLIDSTALVKALSEGRLGGAAVDVLHQEPPSRDEPLLSTSLPNLIVTPHNAWGSLEARQRLLDIAAHHLSVYLSG